MDLGATFDEFQSKLIVENIRAGLAAVNRPGRRGGPSHSMDDEKFASQSHCSEIPKTTPSSAMSSSSSKSGKQHSMATSRQNLSERSGDSTPERGTFRIAP